MNELSYKNKIKIMETIKNESQTVNYVYDVKKLAMLMDIALHDIEKFVKINDYHLTDTSIENMNQLKKVNWVEIFGNASKRSKKRFNKYLLRFRKKNSLYSANLFLHFIHNTLLYYGDLKEIELTRKNWRGEEYKYKKKVPAIDKVKIQLSLKEQAIQEKRRLWVAARDHADRLLSDYKKEKGNYYKL